MSEIITISETFCSIQGEGRYLGCPSIFVRLTGCNLRCQWGDTLCDTPYTSWTPEGESMTIAETMMRVQRLREAHPGAHHAVVTGGEPLLQSSVVELVGALSHAGYFVTVETNGTIFRELEADFISLSPKLASSTPTGDVFQARHERARWNPRVIRQWLDGYDSQLKFVYYQESDEAEILACLGELGDVAGEQIYLMPEGAEPAEIQEHAQACAACCVRNGWRYTPRAHIAIYGNEPGT